ncbi:MAG: M24 family metallopeptidase [Candidatus Thorarchaeota archaeon]
MQFTPQRLERAYRSMRSEQIEALVVTRRQDVHYFTGYESPLSALPVGCVVVEGRQSQLVLSRLQEEALGQDSVMAAVQHIDDQYDNEWGHYRRSSFWNSVVQVLEELGVDSGMIGLQQDRISVKEFDYLKTVLPGAGFKDFSSALWKLRQVKDEAEIEAIRQAAKIADIGIRTALEIVVPGKPEDEASIEIEAAMRAAGGQLRGIRAAVLSGNHAKFPFVPSSASRIGSDALVTIDITVSQAGYFAEVARTLHTGKPSKAQQKLFEGMLQVYKTAEGTMKPGVPVTDVYGKIMKKIRKRVPTDSLLQPIGNSIGLDLQEPPLIYSECDASLRQGMVLSIHPSCYLPEIGAIKIADVLLVTASGVESLSAVARETLV